jgi:hypothetical protein
VPIRSRTSVFATLLALIPANSIKAELGKERNIAARTAEPVECEVFNTTPLLQSGILEREKCYANLE